MATDASDSDTGELFAPLLRAWRERALLTQEALAARANLGVRTIRRLESGALRRPRAESIRLLADALDLTADERSQLTATTRIVQLASRPLRQLPAPPGVFVGREREVTALDSVDGSSTAVITAIDGMAGVGKTALAVQMAQRLADRYPHGQLFIDLHGYTRGITPIAPGDALDRMLRALGVAGGRLPLSVDERAALYRNHLAGRRFLILLDNAASEEQVRPLLPGAAGCLVLVTSRRHLTGLEPSYTMKLETLPLSDAVALFTETAGAQRLIDEPPEPVVELIKLCGGLPLAVQIAAARFRAHPIWTVAHLLERLRHQRHRLDELKAGHRSITAALDLSYQELTGPARRLYRLLGLNPGTRVDEYGAAALADTAPISARQWLDELIDANVLQEPLAGRYTFHDLVRDHASTMAASVEAEPSRRSALTRLFNYYRHTASSAMDIAYPYERARRPRVPPASTPSPALSRASTAQSWIDSEIGNIMLLVGHVADDSWSEPTWHLSAILHRHLQDRGRYRDAEALHHHALTTARTTGDRAGEIVTLTCLAQTNRMQDKHETAADNYRQALALARATDDPVSEMDALTGLGHIFRVKSRHNQAIAHYRKVLDIAHTLGDRIGEVVALAGLGHIYSIQGRLELAVARLNEALEVARAIGHRPNHLSVLLGLGYVHVRQGQYQDAQTQFHQALEIAEAAGQRAGQQDAYLGLGHTYLQQARYELAADHFHQALEISQTIGQRIGEVYALLGLGHIHRHQRRYEDAARSYQQTLDLAQAIGHRNGRFEALLGLGRLHHAAGSPMNALTHHQQALSLAADLEQPADQARVHDAIATIHNALGQTSQARHHWLQALELLGALNADRTEDEETSASAIRANLADLDR